MTLEVRMSLSKFELYKIMKRSLTEFSYMDPKKDIDYSRPGCDTATYWTYVPPTSTVKLIARNRLLSLPKNVMKT